MARSHRKAVGEVALILLRLRLHFSVSMYRKPDRVKSKSKSAILFSHLQRSAGAEATVQCKMRMDEKMKMKFELVRCGSGGEDATR
jgi:hypothetical protein